MKRTHYQWIGVAILLCALTSAECAAQAVRPTLDAKQADQKNLSITVYRSGAAMVRDTRRVDIPQGTIQLKFSDVARDLLPDSVQADSPQLTLLQQTYAYDLLNPNSLLQAYVGKTVTAVIVRRRNGSDVEEPIQATVLAGSPTPVLLIDGKIETGLHVDHYIFPSVPPNLSAKPSLLLLLRNQLAGEQNIKVSYFTNGLSWAANYVLKVGSDWKTADLSARAAINNRSGVDYRGTDLQLIAGEVRRIAEGTGYGNASGMGGGTYAGAPRGRVLMQAAAPPPSQPFAGYHVYTLQQPVDLPNNNLKQVTLIEPKHIQISRIYEVSGQVYYNQGVEQDAILDTPVELRVKFENQKANSIGMPLPAGVVRVYKNDAQGRQQLIGEDQLRDTASDETVMLDLGNAFDVTEKGKQTDFKRLGPRETEASYEITLRNHQSQAIVVNVNEPFNGDWQILSSSLPYTKTSSTSARFDVPVPADGETLLKYQARVQWAQ
ncbi:MAG TPA: DUF4139 domain-containing protein [Terriglobia bacterium]|nr:DUF4139 domain-containing protein [Terriglobia bacterium]